MFKCSNEHLKNVLPILTKASQSKTIILMYRTTEKVKAILERTKNEDLYDNYF